MRKVAKSLTTDHPASSYGIPVLVDRQGQAWGPGDIDLREVTDVTGWRVVQDYSGLTVRATGNGFAQAFASPTQAQARAIWYRYLRAHKLGARRIHPRNFANEYDIVLSGNSFTGPAKDSREDADLIVDATHGRDQDWYGSIKLADSHA